MKDYQFSDSDGRTRISFSIEDGHLEVISFDQSDEAGNKQREIVLDGHFDGSLKLFYPSGVLNKEKEIHGLVAEGQATTYYPNGSVYVEDEYKNGSLRKASVVYDENGNKIEHHE